MTTQIPCPHGRVVPQFRTKRFLEPTNPIDAMSLEFLKPGGNHPFVTTYLEEERDIGRTNGGFTLTDMIKKPCEIRGLGFENLDE